MSSSSVLPGMRTALPFDRGEKQVRTVFKSALRRGIVVRPSTEPVISAVSRPNSFFANALTLAYR